MLALSMPFINEREFETYLRELIRKRILPFDKDLVMIRNKKAVDILICRNGKKPALYFIEIKYHKARHGRLGTGHGKGGGIQPEILQLQPHYFKKQMRWILGTEMHKGYWMLDNKELLEYIAGKEIGEKYNNIQTRLFNAIAPSSEKELIIKLKSWLLL
jgi:hypothetical protein